MGRVAQVRPTGPYPKLQNLGDGEGLCNHVTWREGASIGFLVTKLFGLAALVPKLRVNLTGFHGMLALNGEHRVLAYSKSLNVRFEAIGTPTEFASFGRQCVGNGLLRRTNQKAAHGGGLVRSAFGRSRPRAAETMDIASVCFQAMEPTSKHRKQPGR